MTHSTLSKAARRTMITTLLASAGGRFAAVTFTKKDGTERKLMIQPAAVDTHTTGCKTDAARRAVAARRIKHPNLLPVFDTVAGGIKSINLDTVSRLSIDGVEIKVA